METVINDHHIKVNKMCASCQHKEVDIEGNRICTKMQLKVAQRFCCKQWQMGDGMRNAGMSGGVVKKLTEVIIH